MATSYRIRPKFEAKDAVVKVASFINPATHVPDSAVAIVIGNTLPAYSMVQKLERIRQAIDAVRENDSTNIPGSQYLKVVIPYVGHKANATTTVVAGTDTVTETDITIYVGSDAKLGISEFVDEAFRYIVDYLLEDSKAAA